MLYVWPVAKQEWCCKHEKIGCEVKVEQHTDAVKQACPEVLLVEGAEEEQLPRMGIFARGEKLHDGRPVYANANEQFMYFWGPFKGWRIGDSILSPMAGLKSLPGEDAPCPNKATGWTYFEEGKWASKLPVVITEVDPNEGGSIISAALVPRSRPLRGTTRSSAPSDAAAGDVAATWGAPGLALRTAGWGLISAAFVTMVAWHRRRAQHDGAYSPVEPGVGSAAEPLHAGGPFQQNPSAAEPDSLRLLA